QRAALRAAGVADVGLALELVEGRRLAGDTPLLAVAAEAGAVEAVTEGIEHVALDDIADRHRDRLAGVTDLGATDQAVGGLHRDGAHDVVTEVLGDLEGQRYRKSTRLNSSHEKISYAVFCLKKKIEVTPDY